MNHHTTADFWNCYNQLPEAVINQPGLIAQAAATNAPAATGAIENSVVKIFSTVRYPDPYKGIYSLDA